MNKATTTDDPSVDLIQNMLNSTISMSYPDAVNCMYRNIRCLWKHSEQLRQRW